LRCYAPIPFAPVIVVAIVTNIIECHDRFGQYFSKSGANEKKALYELLKHDPQRFDNFWGLVKEKYGPILEDLVGMSIPIWEKSDASAILEGIQKNWDNAVEKNFSLNQIHNMESKLWWAEVLNMDVEKVPSIKEMEEKLRSTFAIDRDEACKICSENKATSGGILGISNQAKAMTRVRDHLKSSTHRRYIGKASIIPSPLKSKPGPKPKTKPNQLVPPQPSLCARENFAQYKTKTPEKPRFPPVVRQASISDYTKRVIEQKQTIKK
jgi:hypothetical protein